MPLKVDANKNNDLLTKLCEENGIEIIIPDLEKKKEEKEKKEEDKKHINK